SSNDRNYTSATANPSSTTSQDPNSPVVSSWKWSSNLFAIDTPTPSSSSTTRLPCATPSSTPKQTSPSSTPSTSSSTTSPKTSPSPSAIQKQEHTIFALV